jgi:trehalose 6-phosphate synthase/phosphatase
VRSVVIGTHTIGYGVGQHETPEDATGRASGLDPSWSGIGIGSDRYNWCSNRPPALALVPKARDTLQEESIPRLLIVSNRLPITLSTDAGGHVVVTPSAGGLATGLRMAHAASDGLWIGWPGRPRGESGRVAYEASARLKAERLVPVELSADEIRRYYAGFANGVIWPLFHYLLDRLPLDASEWRAYEAVNRKFADATIAVATSDDLIWVHDYQLLLAPAMIRERLPDARIGFFLHIPFPAFEVFRLLPWRRRLLTGLLGADLIGVHTSDYARHCVTALEHLMHLEFHHGASEFLGRRVQVTAFPMGIDADHFAALGSSEQVEQRVASIRTEAGDRRLLLGVDRLDYTKGIPRRLLAFDRLLQRRSDWRESVRFVQVAVPSRGEVENYRAFHREVNELVGRINGRSSTIASVPVHYIHRSVPEAELAALYRAADAMVVTPLRDGMNLVAKEFVASRVDEDGVLILSEFAGAAEELREALVVNPYDLDVVADAMERALTMPRSERLLRMQALRQRVAAFTVHDWVARFLGALQACGQSRASEHEEIAVIDQACQIDQSGPVTLLLDYDGTLVPLAEVPDLAFPDPALGPLLVNLASGPGREVHVVSGRPRDILERWLGGVPVTLWAEHGLWRRNHRTGRWSASLVPSRDWKPYVLTLMEHYAIANPGALVEDKGDSLAWHYRQCDATTGRQAAQQLREEIAELPEAASIETIPGNKVVEARPRGVHKGLAVEALRVERPDAGFIVLGDDRTDEDMFSALPESGFAIHIGGGVSRARHRLSGPSAVRRLLRALAR